MTQAPPLRSLGFPARAQKPLFQFSSDAPLKAHPDYRAAKAGEVGAAIRLVEDLAGPLIPKAAGASAPDAIHVAPHALEATGDNAIPQVLAAALAATAVGGRLDTETVQANKVYHTGADPMERLITRARFEGRVEAGALYLLVEDVTTMGGTLAELAHYIQADGGMVVGVVMLVSASRTGKLVPDRKVAAALERRHGDAIREIFGIAAEALTANEAAYLIGFRDADEVRNRCAKAAQERDRRLRAKGLPEQG